MTTTVRSPLDPLDLPDFGETEYEQLSKAVLEKLSKTPQRNGILGRLSDTVQRWDQLKVLLVGPKKSGKSKLVYAVTGSDEAVSSCSGDSTTRLSTAFVVNRASWIDSPGFSFGEVSSPVLSARNVKDIDAWLSKLLKQHEPHIVLFMSRASIACPPQVVEHILYRLLQRDVTCFYVLSDCCRMQCSNAHDCEVKNKFQERSTICQAALSRLGKRMLHDNYCSSTMRVQDYDDLLESGPFVYTLSPGVLYAAHVNSAAVEQGHGSRKYVDQPKGVVELVTKIYDLTALPREVCNSLLSSARNMGTVESVKSFLKQVAVEVRFPSQRQDAAISLYGWRGGRFILQCLQTIMEHDEETLSEAQELLTQRGCSSSGSTDD